MAQKDLTNANKRKSDLSNVKRRNTSKRTVKPAFSNANKRKAYMQARRSGFNDWKKLLEKEQEDVTKTYTPPKGSLPHTSESGLSDTIHEELPEEKPQKKVVKAKKKKD